MKRRSAPKTAATTPPVRAVFWVEGAVAGGIGSGMGVGDGVWEVRGWEARGWDDDDGDSEGDVEDWERISEGDDVGTDVGVGDTGRKSEEAKVVSGMVYDHGTPVSIPPVTVVPGITTLVSTSVSVGGKVGNMDETMVAAGTVYDHTSPVGPVPMTVVPGTIAVVCCAAVAGAEEGIGEAGTSVVMGVLDGAGAGAELVSITQVAAMISDDTNTQAHQNRQCKRRKASKTAIITKSSLRPKRTGPSLSSAGRRSRGSHAGAVRPEI